MRNPFVPEIVHALRDGYGFPDFRADAVAALTVAIVALPLSMALAIASGVAPGQGLITVVVAGILISLLGGSRYQIGGPAGAFVVIVFNIVAAYGYDGLVLATLMAGAMLIVAALARLGDWIRHVPHPVITGFTAGIAAIIFSSQIRDLFALNIDKMPGDVLGKWAAFWTARDSADPVAILVATGALVLIMLVRKFVPKAPSLLIAVVAASFAVWAVHPDIPTIGSVFGGIPRMLPAPHMPEISMARVVELLPSAFTIAFLSGIESLLCAVVADGMTGRKHRSNCELMAQGIANAASALFGGMPATGTIARTATNVRSGGRSPLAGIMHALFVLLFMLLLAPLAAYIPLAALAAVLVMVSWNMIEREHVRDVFRGPVGGVLAMAVTFFLTVLVDLTVAIAAGVLLSFVMTRASKTAA